MIKTVMLSALMIPLITQAQLNQFATYPVYNGTDLGLTYSKQLSSFRIWSPVAERAQLLLYREPLQGKPYETIDMQQSREGTWTAKVEGDLKGVFYVFRVMINHAWLDEVPDPYAIATGVNGKRAMVIDLHDTNPEGWERDQPPPLASNTDAIIYELHTRDASIAANSGISNKGKYLGLAESGTVNSKGLSTGLDHIQELGVTHVHLLPFFDFLTVDETKPGIPQYNWGYEPLNYNVPEGSYATNPYDGITRIRELKQMISAFHAKGIGLVMDVVYNHTMLTENSYFNQLVPGYYYRQAADGKFSNATACGNETASERPMMRKFMIESLKYWVNEYHIDGFRFDLMGVHDIETMNMIAAELRKIRPGILLYGEGWTAGQSPLPDESRALKKFSARLDDIAVFSDDIRDGLRGSVFDEDDRGFVSGKPGTEEAVKFGVVASCRHSQVNYAKGAKEKKAYSKDPAGTVTYAECHDNHILWDKLALSASGKNGDQRKQMQKLALAVVLTSQGVSFLHAGSEFLRTKKGNENSYNAGDSINAIDWDLKSKHKDVFDFVKALVHLRKEHPAFRMRTGKAVADNIRFLKCPEGVVAYTIDGEAAGDQWKKILVVYNNREKPFRLKTPGERWKVFRLPGQTGNADAGVVEAAAVGCSIFYK